MTVTGVWSHRVLCCAVLCCVCRGSLSTVMQRPRPALCCHCHSLGTHRWVVPWPGSSLHTAWLHTHNLLMWHNLVHALESPNTQADFSAVLCSWFYKSLLPLTACSVTVLAPASALLRLSIFLSCHGYVSHLICDLLSWVRLIVELCASRPLVTQLKLA